MRTQREAERAEQQRIKKLVLSYNDSRGSTADASDERPEDGTDPSFPYILQSNPNHAHAATLQRRIKTVAKLDSSNTGVNANRLEGSQRGFPTLAQANANAAPVQGRRKGQQARKLQLSDVDW